MAHQIVSKEITDLCHESHALQEGDNNPVLQQEEVLRGVKGNHTSLKTLGPSCTDQMGEVNPCILGGVLVNLSKLAWMKNALFCSLELQAIGNHLLEELTHCIQENDGPKGLQDIV